MVATPIDVDSKFLSYILPPCPCSNFAQNIIVQYVGGCDYLPQILSKSVTCSSEAKELHDGTRYAVALSVMDKATE